jgi:hypothetical protein
MKNMSKSTAFDRFGGVLSGCSHRCCDRRMSNSIGGVFAIENPI